MIQTIITIASLALGVVLGAYIFMIGHRNGKGDDIYKSNKPIEQPTEETETAEEKPTKNGWNNV